MSRIATKGRIPRWGARKERADAERVRFSLGSYDEPFAPCDAFAASLSLHHIPTLEAKSVLFARVFDALGQFVLDGCGTTAPSGW